MVFFDWKILVAALGWMAVSSRCDAQEDGMMVATVIKKSSHGVKESLAIMREWIRVTDVLETELYGDVDQRSCTAYIQIDLAERAAKNGMSMLPTDVFLYGGAGQAITTIKNVEMGLEMPLRVFCYEVANGDTYCGYTDAQYNRVRFNMTEPALDREFALIGVIAQNALDVSTNSTEPLEYRFAKIPNPTTAVNRDMLPLTANQTVESLMASLNNETDLLFMLDDKKDQDRFRQGYPGFEEGFDYVAYKERTPGFNYDPQLGPLFLMILGCPLVDTPLVKENPELALDAPLSFVIYEDTDGQTWIAYYPVDYIAERFGENVRTLDALKECSDNFVKLASNAKVVVKDVEDTTNDDDDDDDDGMGAGYIALSCIAAFVVVGGVAGVMIRSNGSPQEKSRLVANKGGLYSSV